MVRDYACDRQIDGRTDYCGLYVGRCIKTITSDLYVYTTPGPPGHLWH